MNFTQKLPIDTPGYWKPFHAAEKEAHPVLPAKLYQSVCLIDSLYDRASD
jgi:hypothetical protein